MALSADPRGVRVPCPSCGQVNRRAFAALDREARCAKCKASLPAPAAPVDLPSAEAFDALTQGSTLPVVVDFWAPWCGPCRMMAPELEKVAAAHAGRWIVAKVNTDELPELGARFAVQAIPTLLVFAGGRDVARRPGALPAAGIEQVVEAAVGESARRG
jgi:thioredoxin 2